MGPLGLEPRSDRLKVCRTKPIVLEAPGGVWQPPELAWAARRAAGRRYAAAMEGTAKPPPAGWYPDPDDGALQRFWNGSRWTNSRMPMSVGVPLETEPRVSEPLPLEPAIGRTGLPAAAWYADPENPEGMRYWDGSRWTEHRTDYRAEPAKPKASEGMVVAGYILAFLFPIAGVVIGAMLMGRGNRHGPWILGLSVVLLVVPFLVVELGDS